MNHLPHIIVGLSGLLFWLGILFAKTSLLVASVVIVALVTLLGFRDGATGNRCETVTAADCLGRRDR